MPPSPRPLVAVVGGSSVPDPIASLAESLGLSLGARGISVLCGGRGGVMAAVCRGLRQARQQGNHPRACHALAIGLLPGTDPGDANPWLDIAIPTGIGHARNAIVATSAQAVIAVAGSAGTLSEIALAWQMGKPLCALASSGWSDRLGGKRVDDRRRDPIRRAESPEDAAAWAARELGLPQV